VAWSLPVQVVSVRRPPADRRRDGAAGRSHKEEHFKKRQTVYHDLLNHERKLEGLIYGKSNNSEGDFVEWQVGFLNSLNAVVILGAEPVARRAIEIQAVQGQLNDSLAARSGTFEDRLAAAYLELMETRVNARRALVDAMRQDVSSDQAALTVWPTVLGPTTDESERS